MTRRLLAAVVFVALPLAATLTVSQTRVTAQRAGVPPRLRAPPPRPACSSTRSTGPPTPAPTSTSSPAAAGSRRTRSRRTARAGAASRSCRSATTRRCARILDAAGRPARDPDVEEDRRLLRVVHGRSGDRREGRRAARSAAEEDRRAAERQRPRAARRRAAHDRRQRVLPVRRRRPTSRTRRSRWPIADQGGLGLPDRDYYFRDDAKSVELRKQYVEHVGKMSALLGDRRPIRRRPPPSR